MYGLKLGLDPSSGSSSVAQIDLVPTLALLLGRQTVGLLIVVRAAVWLRLIWAPPSPFSWVGKQLCC